MSSNATRSQELIKFHRMLRAARICFQGEEIPIMEKDPEMVERIDSYLDLTSLEYAGLQTEGELQDSVDVEIKPDDIARAKERLTQLLSAAKLTG